MSEEPDPSAAKHGKLVRRIRRVGFIVLVMVMAFLLVGVMLSRAFQVDTTHEVSSELKACVQQHVQSPATWTEWTTFDGDGEAPSYEYTGPQRGQGAIMTWRSARSEGRLEIGECNDDGVAFDLSVPSRGRFARGSITWNSGSSPQRIQLRWVEEGELPPIIGGYLSPLVESSLNAHFETSLRRLEEVCVAQGETEGTHTEETP